jgi:predicted component of type VI protein secretion system
MTIQYDDLLEAEREGHMSGCMAVAQAIRDLEKQGYATIGEALEAAARLAEEAAAKLPH